jgi:hypothetical protein
VRTFKSKWFSRFAQKEGITDDELKDIVNDLEQGQWIELQEVKNEKEMPK